MRNLAALVGVALAFCWAFDARWSWVGPLGCAAVAMVSRVFRVPPETLWQGEWLAAGQGDVPSWVVSGVLVVFGVGVFVRFGAKEIEGEEA